MSDAPEMVERVARAIFPEYWPDNTGELWKMLDKELHEFDELRASALTRARAAIEAMRKPTDAMQDVIGTVENCNHQTITICGEDIARGLWPRMIAAALGEDTET